MPRTARASVGGVFYHALNRGNRRETVFHKPADYGAFVAAFADAIRRLPLDLVGYCLMPNHFHLVLRPVADGDLGRWMRWLLTAHAQRYHRHYKTSGHVRQGRFKIFLSRTTTTSPRCSAMSSATPGAPTLSVGPSIGDGRACRAH